jgi:hypothetical protein
MVRISTVEAGKFSRLSIITIVAIIVVPTTAIMTIKIVVVVVVVVATSKLPFFAIGRTMPVLPTASTLLTFLVKSWVSEITIGSIWTKSQGVILAQHHFIMPIATRHPSGTEPLSVKDTNTHPLLVGDMQIHTVVVGTLSVLLEEMAFGHLCQIVLVQKLTQLSLFTQPPQPMLAHHRSIIPH